MRDPLLAGILSLLIPGIGQMYNGRIIIGIIWLPQAFPNITFADPKLIGTFLVWILYGIGLINKFLGKWRGKKLIILSIIGFSLAILSTTLTNFLAKSFHSFY